MLVHRSITDRMRGNIGHHIIVGTVIIMDIMIRGFMDEITSTLGLMIPFMIHGMIAGLTIIITTTIRGITITGVMMVTEITGAPKNVINEILRDGMVIHPNGLSKSGN